MDVLVAENVLAWIDLDWVIELVAANDALVIVDCVGDRTDLVCEEVLTSRWLAGLRRYFDGLVSKPEQVEAAHGSTAYDEARADDVGLEAVDEGLEKHVGGSECSVALCQVDHGFMGRYVGLRSGCSAVVVKCALQD